MLTEAHVVVGLLRFFLLLLLLLSLSSGCCGGSGGRSAGSRGSSHAGSDVGDQVAHVDAFQRLREQTRPVGLYINVGRLQDGGDLLTLQNTTSTNKIRAMTITTRGCKILGHMYVISLIESFQVILLIVFIETDTMKMDNLMSRT